MRRFVYIALFIVAVAAPFMLRLAVTRGHRAAAPPKDAPHLVVITPHTQDIRREFARSFSDWHVRNFGVPVVLDYLTPGGTNDIKRQLEHTYRGFQRAGMEPAPDIDVAWGGGDYFF